MNYMTVTDLTRDQMQELKQSYLFQHFEEVEDREPSMEEIASADSIIDDCIIFEAYDGILFTEEDFCI